MRISSINATNFNIGLQNVYDNSSLKAPSFQSVLLFDCFIPNPLNKLKNFTIAEYKSLSAKDIISINRHIKRLSPKNLKNYVAYHDIVASGIKMKLDKLYGAGNYAVIPIGRSLSSIGKCLGYKIGEDNVKPLPLSNAARFLLPEKLQNDNENFDVLCEYLDSIGLSKKEVESSGKKYILTDYCITGNSLAGTEKLFKSEKIWGDLPNVIAINALSLINDIEPSSIRRDAKHLKKADFIETMENMLIDNEFKKYSLVHKCKSLSETPFAVIKPENYSDNMKIFLFKLLDNEMKNTKFTRFIDNF